MATQEPSSSAILFREASTEEDNLLSRILCNAFMPLWNHNWFHGVSKALEPVPVYPENVNVTPRLSHAQSVRVRFYLALIKLTRLISGKILVAEVPALNSDKDRPRCIGAILLWVPPNKPANSPGIHRVYQSGFLSLMLPWNYGLGARHRIEDVFEANIKQMFAETLPSRGVKHEECGFVQMIASNQAYAGKGYASALLTHQLEQHFAEFPKAPVVLDTTTVSAIRAYERLGFELLAEKPVDTGTDARGILLKKDADEATREAARKMCIQRIMVKMPPL